LPDTPASVPPRRILIGLPAFNEEIALPRLLDRIEAFRSTLPVPVEVVLYNDGSRDRTVAIAEERQRAMPLTILGTVDNRGLGAGLRTLVAHGATVGADDDILVLMDCDDTHDPVQIRDMLALMDRERLDVVVASRFVAGATVRGVPALRRFTALGAMLLFKSVHPVPGVRDYTCGYRAYRISLLKRAHAAFGDRLVEERGFACMVELLLKLATLTRCFGEIPLTLRYDLKPTESKMDVGGNTRRLLQLLWRWRTKGFAAR
jgi:dolichol-phosphate mannosyltransferase